jgi:GNAT superfamily N-acetyltransferase
MLLRSVGRVTTLFGMPARVPSISRASAAVAGAALAAAALGYSIHHLGPLQDHTFDSVVLAVGAAMLLAALPATAAASRELLPRLLVATPASHHVRPASHADARFCAALHAESLPHGFFTQLGPGFLRAYHRSFVDSPHAVAYVATVTDVPVGMLVGVIRPGAHTRWVMRHRGVRLALLGVAGLGVRPITGFRFLERRAGRYLSSWRRNRRRGGPPTTRHESAILSHVAVVPGARRTGAGRRLVEAFVEACRAEDAPRAILLTLDSPEGAGAFYAALGWRPGEVRTTPDGHRMREWVLFTPGRDR